jgi:hypothetical protein
MKYKIVIDGNKFYEIDQECLKKNKKNNELKIKDITKKKSSN